jgi:phenylalanyl-tRNA synthetase beta chain
MGWLPGERSLAVRLALQAQEATLTEEQIQAAVDAAVSRAHAAFGARLRA